MRKLASLPKSLRTGRPNSPVLQDVVEAARIGKKAKKDLARFHAGDPNAPSLKEIQHAVARAQRLKADARYKFEFPTDQAHADRVKGIKKGKIRDWVRTRLSMARIEKKNIEKKKVAGVEMNSQQTLHTAFLDELEKIAAVSGVKNTIQLVSKRTGGATLRPGKMRALLTGNEKKLGRFARVPMSRGSVS